MVNIVTVKDYFPYIFTNTMIQEALQEGGFRTWNVNNTNNLVNTQ